MLNRYGIELKHYLTFLNSLQIPIIQYRNKIYNPKEIQNDLILIKSEFRGALIVNDYLEFIDLADGLHLGQDDLTQLHINHKIAINILRDIVKKKFLGLSTHNLKEIKNANVLNINYIGLGAYRDTDTKENVCISGVKLLDIAKKSKHKVALIGGVRLKDDFTDFPQINYKVIGSDLMKHFLSNL